MFIFRLFVFFYLESQVMSYLFSYNSSLKNLEDQFNLTRNLLGLSWVENQNLISEQVGFH